MPAGVQLSRINKKLDVWDRTQSLVQQRKQERELWARNIIKKEDLSYVKANKIFQQKQKEHKDQFKEKNETRDGRIMNFKRDNDLYQKEVNRKIKEYWAESKAYLNSKEEREKEILAKLMEYYDSYKGAKADELLKKTREYLSRIEEGQELNDQIQFKMQEKEQHVNDLIYQKGFTQKQNNERVFSEH